MTLKKPLYLVLIWIVISDVGVVVHSKRIHNQDDTSYESDLLHDQVSWPANGRKSSHHPSYRQNKFSLLRSERRNDQLRRSMDKKPNIILVITDDQDVELGSLNFMPKTLRILGEGGAHFPNAYVTSPMCCPSRSSMLTGLYVHNHNVYTNNDNCSSPQWQQEHETRTFATYLSNAGYQTAYFGKYLNEYNGNYIPPGWREWAGLIRNSRFYNYTINMNGSKIKHGDDYYQDYYPDLIANDSVKFLRLSKQHFANKPVMLVMSFPSPHGPEDSAPQYYHLFHNITTHRTPSWNYAPNNDKQWILRHTGNMEPVHMKFTDILHTKRLQTLQSVDDAIEKLYNELKKLEELENTYIFYTSDHGYHLGQFGLIKGKSQPFEFDVRVPFLVRGPFVPKGVRISDVVLNIDLAPSFLELGGVVPPEHMDGMSIVPLLKDAYEQFSKSRVATKEIKPKKGWRGSFLIERGKGTKDFNTFEPEKIFSKRKMIAEKCGNQEYSSPCQPYQKWECIRDGYRWRVRKCRNVYAHHRRNRNKRRKNCWCVNEGTIRPYTDRALEAKQRVQSEVSFDFLSDTTREFSMNAEERKLQRKFLKEHVRHGFRPIFIGSRKIRDTSGQKPVKSFDGVTQLSHWLDLTVENSVNSEGNSSTEIKWYGEDDLSSSESGDSGELVYRNTKHRISERSVSKLSQSHVYHSNFYSPGCVALSNNSVICVDPVYYDQKIWRKNKNQIDVAIKDLKYKLLELKGLRRQLKKKRPMSGTKNSGYLKQGNDGYPLSFSQRCYCEDDAHQKPKAWKQEQRELRKLARQRIKEARSKQKEKENRRKAKYKKFDCNTDKMNCFTHNNDHWKTPPYWTYGPFCFCQNSNNNTYWCLRTINASHNFLYCEFITGFIMYFDLKMDPYQLTNAVYNLEYFELQDMRRQLNRLRRCTGTQECFITSTLPGQGRRKGSIPILSSWPSERHHHRGRDRSWFPSEKRNQG
ncbi:putative extracellular sulfatase Sulf-1 homolog isoform X1 [Limulus polyphemus]|uniref:Extracellular sulfatase Sulf-1 homolog isoform X1 n=1 Tax=Limulus polyphemus TaxID=6850 RepID=A0ABM1B1G5_LIMPO|nr:putative extracellular sulfatase Sulf-1 homolog isoform X1 [Limulus polyphemus]XP_013772876.1 putative extracellular sulfatase Sulf-1 homolog isoform X1 [Limulus polyphemus]XP_013772877.1 putative extracellular sulfatase Sulf-1 homolog isoform X1 [Limulus polyphemus]